jgi:hypothetical protein
MTVLPAALLDCKESGVGPLEIGRIFEFVDAYSSGRDELPLDAPEVIPELGATGSEVRIERTGERQHIGWKPFSDTDWQSERASTTRQGSAEWVRLEQPRHPEVIPTKRESLEPGQQRLDDRVNRRVE